MHNVGDVKDFLNDQDRGGFLIRLAELGREELMRIFAWALLPNHFHFLRKTQKQPLASNIHKLLTG